MKSRCNSPSNPKFNIYGGRGISVCDEWQSFKPFQQWALANGYQEDLTIDRIDNDGNYCPENCRWATITEQANNKRNNHLITFNGETHNITKWAEINGIPRSVIYDRLLHGWAAEKAITAPVAQKRREY